MLRIRLRRQGSRNNPFYRVVVSDRRSTPFGRAVEEVGYYDPTQEPPVVHLKEERIDHWIEQGAIISPTVKRLRGKGTVSEESAAGAGAEKDGAGESPPESETAESEAAEPQAAAAEA